MTTRLRSTTCRIGDSTPLGLKVPQNVRSLLNAKTMGVVGSNLSLATQSTDLTWCSSGPSDDVDGSSHNIFDDGEHSALSASIFHGHYIMDMPPLLSKQGGDYHHDKQQEHEHQQPQIPTNVTVLSPPRKKDTRRTLSLQERLEHAEALVDSYQNSLKSSQHLIGSLQKNLVELQNKAEELVLERDDLCDEVEDMRHDQTSRQDQKVVMLLGLLAYAILGNEYILLIVVALCLLDNLFDTPP